MDDLMKLLSFLCWNVRGLNDPDRQTVVNDLVASSSCHIACLQETKLQNVDQFTAAYLGGGRLRGYAQRPALGTRGGILLLWDENFVNICDVEVTEFCLSAKITSVHFVLASRSLLSTAQLLPHGKMTSSPSL